MKTNKAIKQAYDLLEQQKISEAKKAFTKLCRANRTDTELWLSAGAVCGMAGDADGAIEHFEHILKIQPKHMDALMNLGFAYEQQDKVIEAISSLMAPDAKALVVADGKNEGENHDGPPWPLTVDELRLFTNKSCTELELNIFDGEGDTSSLKLRAIFKKC